MESSSTQAGSESDLQYLRSRAHAKPWKLVVMTLPSKRRAAEPGSADKAALMSARILRAAATLKVRAMTLFGGGTSPDASSQHARPVIAVVFP